MKEDPWFKRTVLTLTDMGFAWRVDRGSDTEPFGNWVLVGFRDNVALRVYRDRDQIGLDLMPAHLFSAGAPESEWYTWDVVAAALGIPFKPENAHLASFHEYLEIVDHEFAPAYWERTRGVLAQVEAEKRRRFTEGRRQEHRVPAHT